MTAISNLVRERGRQEKLNAVLRRGEMIASLVGGEGWTVKKTKEWSSLIEWTICDCSGERLAGFCFDKGCWYATEVCKPDSVPRDPRAKDLIKLIWRCINSTNPNNK